ncbi:D-3-phosphoglycerate dehydrogenase [Streptomyces sp. ADI96-02]|uniref:hydroxyacid dehydrogenase n=1 Tax=unclassified Streptomyces TaxID=2593676 RepID=UPI000F55539A|nr:hydroxyacid dehydrogenase [Streptomyces sp. ADI96-02]RPK59954.1 D-3-phosphoglycerate dehydrogenase [Streptomyces sp. ADI96-02]
MHPTADASADTSAAPGAPTALLAMGPGVAEQLFTAGQRRRLTALVDTDPALVAHRLTDPTPEVAAALAGAELLITCWGAPPLTAEVLAAAPRLRAVVHAAGSVKHHVTPACWERGIAVASAAGANALPVAEYTLAAILFAGKNVRAAALRYRELRAPHDWRAELAGHGNYRRAVGIVGASRIGRRVIELLRPFDLDVLLFDPYVDGPGARALGVEAVELDELCARSRIVSVHAPELPATRHMIGAAQLAAMADGTTLINTARGSLVDGDALLPELVSGRLNAVLDVTEPDIPPAGSPLYELENVLLTPHVAGSLGEEIHRMADFALEEVARYARGLPFADPVSPDALGRSA